MYLLLALVSLVVAVGSFYYFQSQENGSTSVLVVGIVFAILTAIFGVIYLSSRLNKTDDIHITE